MTALLARTLLVALFPFSALDKMLHWDEAMSQCRTLPLPAPLPTVALLGAMLVELSAPACIVADWQARPAAFVLAAFCCATAVLYHPFWRQGDFWARGPSLDRGHFWDFVKNFGLAGGLLLVGLGAGLAPLA